MNEIANGIYSAGKLKQPLPMLDVALTSIHINNIESTQNPSGKYYLVGESNQVSLEATISGENGINIPYLAVVLERLVDDRPSGEEIYFNGSIVDDVLSVSGVFPTSSNYKMTQGRNNRALDRFGAGFALKFEKELDFIVIPEPL